MTKQELRELLKKELKNLFQEAIIPGSEESSNSEGNLGDLESDLEGELKDIATDVAKELEKKGDTLTELEPITFTISAIFALPAVIEGLGSVMKLIAKATKFSSAEKVADKVIKAGHKVHNWFVKPIKFVLKKRMPEASEEDIKNTAETIHKAIIFVLLIVSGVGAAKAIAKSQVGAATAEAILTAIKGSELGTFVTTKI